MWWEQSCAQEQWRPPSPTLFLFENKLLTSIATNLWHLMVEEAVREILFRQKPRPWEEHDLPSDPKLLMELGPELTAANSWFSAPSTQVGLDVRGWGVGTGKLWKEIRRAAKHQLSLIKFLNAYKILPYMISFEVAIISILQVRHLELREVKWLLQGHTAFKWQNQGSDPDLQAPWSVSTITWEKWTRRKQHTGYCCFQRWRAGRWVGKVAWEIRRKTAWSQVGHFPCISSFHHQSPKAGHRVKMVAVTGSDHSLASVLECNSALGTWEALRVASGIKLIKFMRRYHHLHFTKMRNLDSERLAKWPSSWLVTELGHESRPAWPQSLSRSPLGFSGSVEVCRMKLDMREAWRRCKEKGPRRLTGPVNDLGGKGAPCDSPLCSVGRYCPRSISQILSSFYSL